MKLVFLTLLVHGSKNMTIDTVWATALICAKAVLPLNGFALSVKMLIL